MQFSTIIATFSLALVATAAPVIEARTGGGSQPGKCSITQYSHPVCCNGFNGSAGDEVSITIVGEIAKGLECAIGGNIIGNVCGQNSNSLCCDQDVENNQVRRTKINHLSPPSFPPKLGKLLLQLFFINSSFRRALSTSTSSSPYSASPFKTIT